MTGRSGVWVCRLQSGFLGFATLGMSPEPSGRTHRPLLPPSPRPGDRAARNLGRCSGAATALRQALLDTQSTQPHVFPARPSESGLDKRVQKRGCSKRNQMQTMQPAPIVRGRPRCTTAKSSRRTPAQRGAVWTPDVWRFPVNRLHTCRPDRSESRHGARPWNFRSHRRRNSCHVTFMKSLLPAAAWAA